MKKKCLLFCGPSGSGKTTVVHHLLQQFDKLRFSVSATTRPRRTTEVDGVDYHFMSIEEFRKAIDNQRFVEWEEVYDGRYYGTLKSEVERLLQQGYHPVFDVDVIGGIHLKEYFGPNMLAVFVHAPNRQALEDRLKKRGTESEETLDIRIKKAEQELSYRDRFDKVLVNTHLRETCTEAENLVKNFLSL
ncbi:MAG TPA: guanylate kinase [Bacteroidia bacterium]|nr:guanylate kinase [Bacteroidia bacterium]HNT80795.1 guanylate kinase [Bacteroidia bacterium]